MRWMHLSLRVTLVLALAVLAVPAVSADEVVPALDFQLENAEAGACQALILPPANNAAEEAANAEAVQRFQAFRAAVEPTPKVCAVVGDLNSATAPLTCGDCGGCLSAASCSGCAVGAVCSPPGAVPTRACRAVKVCSGNLRCCGCS